MPRPMSIWKITDPKTKKVVFEGTTNECAEFIGCKPKTFHTTMQRSRNGRYKQYVVTEEFCATEPTDDAEAIYNWDRFMEPLRRKYGIPVKRMRC